MREIAGKKKTKKNTVVKLAKHNQHCQYQYAYLVVRSHLVALMNKMEHLILQSIGGSVVECSPATRAARVRFSADAFLWDLQACLL